MLHFTGYYFVYYSLNNQIEKSWQTRFEENNFEKLDLREMTLDISFPYLSDQKEFILVDEQMEINGKVYRIVKKRYHQGRLDIVYINDLEKEDLNSVYADWKKDLSDKNSTTTSQFSFNLSISYCYYSNTLSFQPLQTEKANSDHPSLYVNLFNSIYLDITVPPPKFS